MKKIIIKFSLFLLPFILLAYSTDLFLSNNLKKSTIFADGEYPIWNNLLEGKVNADIIVSGASNAYRGLDPSIISEFSNTPVFNLAVNGHNFRTQYARFSLLLERNKKPSLIIQAITAATLEKADGLYNPDQFLPYLLFHPEFKEVVGEFKDYQAIDYWVPSIRYFTKKQAIIEAIRSFLQPSHNIPYRINGFKAVETPWNNDFVKAREKIKSRAFVLDSSLLILFEKFIIECKQNGIKLILVNPPEYIEGQPFIRNRAEMMAPFRVWSEKYNIPYLSYLSDSLSYNKDYFFNSGHLNKKGAECFTHRFMNDLQALEKQENSPNPHPGSNTSDCK